MITTVQGLPPDLDYSKILKYFKDTFHCGGKIASSSFGTVIQLQGQHSREITDFLIEEGLASRDQITVHGAYNFYSMNRN